MDLLTTLSQGVKSLLSESDNSSVKTVEDKEAQGGIEDKKTPNNTPDRKKEGGQRRNPQPRQKKSEGPVRNNNQNDQKSEVNTQQKSIVDSTVPTEGQAAQNQEPTSMRTLLMKQLEYYFSDENLQRDKFLEKEAEKDETGQGYISLDILATFQRVKRFTKESNSSDELRAAINESTIIKLNKTGDKVKRVIPYHFPVSEEQRERKTIYVRYLPKHSNQDSVKGIFGICGVIKRVDIPVEKKTGEIKGIAFIEFESRKQARKAIAYFSDRNNDFFKLGMRVSQYTNRAAGVTSPEAANSPITSPQHRYLQQQYHDHPVMNLSVPQHGDHAQEPISPRGNNHGNQHGNHGNQHGNHGNQHGNQGNQQGNHGNQHAGQHDVNSVYDGAPTFNYSKQDKRKRRGSGPNEAPHANAPSASAERPRLQLRPRSASEASPLHGAHSGVTPLRQPKGPDGTKGFPMGRGKLI